ncbi:M56 family metallopeptidase [Sphingomonas sp. PB4P5]|uniref:M56 family metallopeptidase n=1 Tax=Parasphingomonas puruogangriensis TaxID=3096155 RepID=UPI002FC85F2C
MIGWGIETLVATTLLMALVLAIRAPVRTAFGPHVAYALWSMPVIRLFLPSLPGDWGLSRLIGPLTQQAAAAPGMVMGVLNPATLPAEIDPSVVTRIDLELAGHHAAAVLVPPTRAADGPNLLLLLLGLWAVGALVFLGYHLIAHRRFCRHLIARARADRTVAEGRVRVIETDAAHGPLAFGIWRKYVAFPRDFTERYDEIERDLALAHELGHHIRGDLIANWVALFVLAIHWFNPIAWRAFRAFRADQEMACDALVLAGRAQTLRHAYGRAIVKSAHGGAVSAACHLHTINDLKGRLKMLTTRKTSRSRMIGGAAAVAALTIAGLGLTASGTLAAETVRQRVETTTGLDLAGHAVAPPAPPAPPTKAELPQPPEAAELPEPPTPPAPPTPARNSREVITTSTTGDDGRTISRIKVVTRDKHGKVHTQRWDTPEVLSQTCAGAADSKEMVLHQMADGKRRIIICTNRIEAAAAHGAMVAANSQEIQRNAHRAALAGLRTARASLETNRALAADARAEALAGIDEAIAEAASDRATED